MEKITMSGEDYLEAILVLGGGDEVKSSAVAAMLSVSPPAVNKAMGELASMGLVDKRSYGKITLTEAGLKEAARVRGRHTLLHDFLVSIGVSEKTAAIDCCKIEHFVSEETVKCLTEFMHSRK